ncbi:MAG: hypothetical protein KA764_02175 [Anaerolineales bacterium]|nr:hypothetical protein [Anaerolineales bacterium]
MSGAARRAFLKLGAALAAGIGLRPSAPAGAAQPGALAAALPLDDCPCAFISDAERLTAQAGSFDAVLVPAYAAARLIQRGAARPFTLPAGAPGRAHDAAGRWTRPGATRVLALVYHGAPPAQPAWTDVFQPHAIWPDYGRLALAAALLRRGWLPDDPHPGRWARAEADLRAAEPSLAADPVRALQAGRGAVALALVDPAAPPPGAARLPAAALRISYEWVLMRSARRPAAAEARLRHLPLVSPPGERAFTLGGWPAAGPARLAAWWARIRPALSVSPA